MHEEIEEACKTFYKTLLVSEYLVNYIELPDGFSADEVGNVKLRGKEMELKLFPVEIQLT